MTPRPGLILDSPIAISELPDFEILSGGSDEESGSWLSYVPRFRSQGPTRYCTAFAGAAIASMFNKKEHPQETEATFSPAELFFRSGGSLMGNSLLNTMLAMRDTMIFESDVPTKIPDGWGTGVYNRLKKISYSSAAQKEAGKPFAIKSVSNVTPTDRWLRAALKQSPVMIAIPIGAKYNSPVAPNPPIANDYHAVALLCIENDGTKVVFDSLSFTADFNGIHKLAPDYDILYALSSLDLPNDWYETQQKAKQSPFLFALNHYGLPRNYFAELEKANLLNVTLKSHPTLLAGAGKNWTVLINALAYGLYSIQDVLNHLTQLRRTGESIFDFNTKRS